MRQMIETALKEAQQGLAALLADAATLKKIEETAHLMVASLRAGGTLFSCGNGGSMCDAMHFAEELTGRYRKNRRALRAVSMSDAGYLSCAANDFGYEFVFSRYAEAHGRQGDVLLAISTSGKSANVIKAAQTARTLGMKVVALTGAKKSPLGEIVDIDLCTPAGSFADRVQELHIKVIHILIELIEREIFSENY